MSKQKKHGAGVGSEKPLKEDKPQHLTVDALEGDKARLEVAVGQTRDVPLADLPEGVQEGDVLRRGKDGQLEVDRGETDRRRQAAQTRLDALNGRQEAADVTPAGEIQL